MSRDLNLDGVEISLIKALGFSGGEISGKELMERVPELEQAEIIDTIKGLISVGYVLSDKAVFRDRDELEGAHFNVNSGYARELKEALNPRPEKPKSKRVRRE